MKISRFAVLLGLAACHANAPGPDASQAAAVCANLARVGCPEGANPNCAAVLERAVSEGHATMTELSCAGDAASRAGVIACAPMYLTCIPETFGAGDPGAW